MSRPQLIFDVGKFESQIFNFKIRYFVNWTNWNSSAQNKIFHCTFGVYKIQNILFQFFTLWNVELEKSLYLDVKEEIFFSWSSTLCFLVGNRNNIFWTNFMIIIFYHHVKTPIDFWCRQIWITNPIFQNKIFCQLN